MTLLSNFFYFIIALGILVTIHEYGHFWVARKLGVKVLTFSVGFGRSIWQRRAKDGVDYVIGAIPLGGYVKMLDEREAEVAPEEREYAFNRKPVWVRAAIVVAGPLANFALAILLYWWMFLSGISGLSTEMGEIDAGSIAGRAGLIAGDTINRVDGEAVYLLDDVVKSIARRLGEKTEIKLEVVRAANQQSKNIYLSLNNWKVDTARPEILKSLGIRHKIEDLVIPPLVHTVGDNTPASRYGLLAGDRIKSIDEQTVKSWQELVKQIEPNPGKEVELLIERNGELRKVSVVIGSRQSKGKKQGFIGISYPRPEKEKYFLTRKGGGFESFKLSVEETGKMISLTIQLFKKLLTGDLSPKSLSGPFSIAEGAGGSARAGLVYFISFVAMISVNLGFINLLPIPLLDGGHLLYFSIEAVKGRPLSEKAQEMGMQIGMLLVVALMATAIFNDILRL